MVEMNSNTILVGNLLGYVHLEDQCWDRRITLRWILGK